MGITIVSPPRVSVPVYVRRLRAITQLASRSGPGTTDAAGEMRTSGRSPSPAMTCPPVWRRTDVVSRSIEISPRLTGQRTHKDAHTCPSSSVNWYSRRAARVTVSAITGRGLIVVVMTDAAGWHGRRGSPVTWSCRVGSTSSPAVADRPSRSRRPPAGRWSGGSSARGSSPDARRRLRARPRPAPGCRRYRSLVERRADEAVLGRAGLWQPEGWPGVEVGWMFARSAWGHGYATEAARAAVDWAWANLDSDRLISLIAEENERSIHVAERLAMCRAGRHEHDGVQLTVYELGRQDQTKPVTTRPEHVGS